MTPRKPEDAERAPRRKAKARKRTVRVIGIDPAGPGSGQHYAADVVDDPETDPVECARIERHKAELTRAVNLLAERGRESARVRLTYDPAYFAKLTNPMLAQSPWWLRAWRWATRWAR